MSVFSHFTACLQTPLNSGKITWSLMAYCIMRSFFKNRCILKLMFCALQKQLKFKWTRCLNFTFVITRNACKTCTHCLRYVAEIWVTTDNHQGSGQWCPLKLSSCLDWLCARKVAIYMIYDKLPRCLSCVQPDNPACPKSGWPRSQYQYQS